MKFFKKKEVRLQNDYDFSLKDNDFELKVVSEDQKMEKVIDTKTIQTHDQNLEVFVGDYKSDNIWIGEFEVFQDDSRWTFAQEICCLGGCATNFLYFEKKKEAIDKANELVAQGRVINIGMPCPSCAQNYYSDH